MTIFLRQSTATQSILIGPFIDNVDFITPKTALTILNTDIKLSKNGGVGVNKNSGGATHRNNGMYSITLDSTDTNTVGELKGSIADATSLVVSFSAQILEASTYDALFAITPTGFDVSGRVDIGSIIGVAQSAIDLKDFADAGYDPVTNKVQGVVLTDTVTNITPDTSGSVVTDGGNSATSFKTDLTETSTDHWKDSFLKITSGTLNGAVKKVTAYNGTTKIITVNAFPSTPADAVTFEMVNE